jgi:hypothetical protein
MAMSHEHQQRLLSHVQSKLKAGCPLCGARDMTIEDTVQFLGLLDSEYRQPIEGTVHPVVAVVCNNCFHVMHFSALKLGILR